MMYYMSVEELKAIMPSIFPHSALERVGWYNYTPEDLNAILGQSEGFIDSLRYKGQFKEHDQAHSFPRILPTGKEVSQDDERIKMALCYVVYDLLKFDESREDLIMQGVKSISTGGVSESYGEIKDVKRISDNYKRYLGVYLFNRVL